MNTKKLIGMIIGVVMFAALIAGATFAWLTYTATTSNGTIRMDGNTSRTRNFTFSTTTGSAMNGTITTTIAGQPKRNAFASMGGYQYYELTLSKAADTPYASSVKLVLKKPVNQITATGVWRYAVCRGGSVASTCNNSSSNAIPSSTNTANWVVVNGEITTGTAEQVLWEDTASKVGTSTSGAGNVFKDTGAASATYYVYFWLDAAAITDANFNQVDQKYVDVNMYFEATQGGNQ